MSVQLCPSALRTPQEIEDDESHLTNTLHGIAARLRFGGGEVSVRAANGDCGTFDSPWPAVRGRASIG